MISGDLRAALHPRPTPEAWGRLCRQLEALEERVGALPLSTRAEERLERRGVQVIRFAPREAIRVQLSGLDAEGPHHEILPGDRHTIGRTLACGLQIGHATINRRHALLTRRGDALWVEDPGSTSGISVNGMPAAAPRQLHPQDRLVPGHFTLQFEIVASRDQAPPTEEDDARS